MGQKRVKGMTTGKKIRPTVIATPISRYCESRVDAHGDAQEHGGGAQPHTYAANASARRRIDKIGLDTGRRKSSWEESKMFIGRRSYSHRSRILLFLISK
jgi:hypothetical protein